MTALARLWQRTLDRLHRLPLRVRLIAVLTGLLLVALVLSSLATAYLTQRDLLQRIDSELTTVAAPVANQALDDLRRADGYNSPTNYGFVLMDAQGQQISFTEPTGVELNPAVPPLPVSDLRVQTHQPFTVESTNGDTTWRFVAGSLGNGKGTFAVGIPLSTVDRTVTRLALTTLLIGVLLLLVMSALGWYAVNRAFRPLRRIEDTAAAIAGGDLTRRIPLAPADDEVTSLSRSLNVMLARIEESFDVREASEQRMRQFVADASHELRTPLATVRGYAELYRQGAVTKPEDVGTAMSRIESESERMSGLVEDLLLLARMDEQRQHPVGPVDVMVLAVDAVSDAKVRDPERPIKVSGLASTLESTMAIGSESALRQVVTNLLANALRHTPAGSPVDVLVGYDDAESVVVVRDHGHGIPEEDRPRVFERFYRADPSRGRSAGGGNGLGLAIVAAIVDAHHGRVGVSETPGGGATFIVSLPTADSQPSPSRD